MRWEPAATARIPPYVYLRFGRKVIVYKYDLKLDQQYRSIPVALEVNGLDIVKSHGWHI